MQVMIEFCSWFLSQMPAFLWAEPIRYLWALILMSYVLKIIFSIFSLR